MTKQYKLINNVLGWLIGIFASAVYIMTAEPTASWWDCGEYISTCYKLLVGHPPGAPTFQLIGRLFSMFAGGDVTKVAFCINTMSALCSGMTIMFLFWTMTMLGRKLVAKLGDMTPGRMVALFGSALVGALTYTFTDTFWFSAVEGEVYAMSSFFTALVFWCILKWDIEYDNQKANVNPNRWIVLIAYLVGLSIGVHLLNLLTLPAIVLVIYFKLSKNATVMGVVQTIGVISAFGACFFSTGVMFAIWILVTFPCLYFSIKKGTVHSKAEWGVLFSLLLSFVLLGVILYGIIPGIVKMAGKFELMFVNGVGLPFNTGLIIFFLLVFGLIAWGLYYGYTKNKKVFLAGVYSFLFILIGYSTFLILVIRSNSNPTIDENNPEDAVALLAYLNREQYGSNPLIYGQSFNSRVIDYKDGTPVYVQNEENGKYVVSDKREGREPVYKPSDCMLFPRMWDRGHQGEYLNWLKSFYENDKSSQREIDKMARQNMVDWKYNIKFMQTYQFDYMYFRYFMWNFSGRQNDIQGHGGLMEGNFITGIPFIDKAMLGDQTDLPNSLKRPGTNKYYMLPLLLGLIGLFYYSIKDGKNSFIVLMLFLMTGLAIGFYLNMYAFQPRERDYAFAASFYAFSIWVGFGVFAIYSLFEKMKSNGVQVAGALLTTLICLGLVPGIMASENWDDHDRSDRYTALAIAKNYLDSCAPNAILFTLGDNDTFPLWYAQEVEGYRTDVRVCNLSLLSTSWYVDQMKRKAYNSEPLPISMTWDQYKDGTRDLVVLDQAGGQYIDLSQVLEYIKQPMFDGKSQILLLNGSKYRSDGQSVPASFSLPVDREKVLANGTVEPKDSALIVDKLRWNLKGGEYNQVLKAYLVMMDILANNNWERPIYYASTTGPEAYLGLEEYFQLEGLAYRLVPIKSPNRGGYGSGRINSDILYDNIVNVFIDHSRTDRVNNPDAPQKESYPYAWGGLNDPKVYNPEDNIRLTPLIRNTYQRLADALISEGNAAKAELALDKGNEVLPNEVIPYVSTYRVDYSMLCIGYMQAYNRVGTPTAREKALKMANDMVDSYVETFAWFEGRDDRTLQIQSENIVNSF
ncbi:MAG: DUF2723 domain-containing protein, partial [Bacteroidales bacterium]|nr:DUF2723 domain-containing protein [Bacteroidales bacterium]